MNQKVTKRHRIMFEIRAFLLFVCLALLCAILILILINAIRRTFFTNVRKHTNDGNHNTRVKYVDLYSSSFATLPTKDALPGMTALIDLGVANLETGIYMLQNADSWIKVSVPEFGDCYHILRGASAGKQHTINASFTYEIQPPRETQIFAAELFQELHESTQVVFVQPDVRMPCHLSVPSQAGRAKHASAFPAGRVLKIINASTFAFIVSAGDTDSDKIVVNANTIREVHLMVDSSNPLAPYRVGAVSA